MAEAACGTRAPLGAGSETIAGVSGAARRAEDGPPPRGLPPRAPGAGRHRLCGDKFLPAAAGEVRAPTEITLTFEIAGGLQHLDTVYFYLNQFTRRGCNNGNGGKISDGLVLLGAPSGNDEWQAEYYEGSVDNMYNDSYIILKAKYDVIGTAATGILVVIDASNDIRPNCADRPANSSLMRVKGFVYKDAKAQYIRPVNKSDAVDLTCYMTDTRLKFRPAIPKASARDRSCRRRFSRRAELRTGAIHLLRRRPRPRPDGRLDLGEGRWHTRERRLLRSGPRRPRRDRQLGRGSRARGRRAAATRRTARAS